MRAARLAEALKDEGEGEDEGQTAGARRPFGPISCELNAIGVCFQVKQSATFDTSFWVNAHRSGLLPYVLGRYELYYASAVALELRATFPSGAEFWQRVVAGALSARDPTGDNVRSYGSGERAAMNLALEHTGWVLLLDDYRPFQEAERLGINVICTPAFVLALFVEEVVLAAEALAILARLAALQTVSPALVVGALAQLGRRQR